MKCKVCGQQAAVALKSHNAGFCEEHFLKFFRRQLEKGIESQKLFTRDEKVLVALSGGKDSLSLMLELHELGYNASGLFIDLSIPGSSEEAREFVAKFCGLNGLPLLVLDLAEEGLAIPEVRKKMRRPICSVCGKIKRYYFNKIALEGGFDALATGHNLDDEVGRLFSNVLRWDESYLADQGPYLPASGRFVRKVKPLWRLTEFETACYAFLRGIPHHKAGCPYSKGASFTGLKGIMQNLENLMPGKKLDFYQTFLKQGRGHFAVDDKSEAPSACAGCGYPVYEEGLCGICRIKKMLAEL